MCKSHYALGFASDKQGETDWLQNQTNIQRIYVAPNDTAEDIERKISRYCSNS